MRLGHDFLTRFTQYSKFDNINSRQQTVRYQVKIFFNATSKVDTSAMKT
jgi:hypothetical protein